MSKDDESVIFVFYTVTDEADKWEYTNVPKDWWWVGKGTIHPTDNKVPKDAKYLNEEQFQGPKKSRNIMKKYLNDVFKELKNDGWIKYYAIRYTYRVPK